MHLVIRKVIWVREVAVRLLVHSASKIMERLIKQLVKKESWVLELSPKRLANNRR